VVPWYQTRYWILLALQITTTPDVCMELLVDKLKLLDYERDFCRKK
jgi:estrogen-related receptor beta like 1